MVKKLTQAYALQEVANAIRERKTEITNAPQNNVNVPSIMSRDQEVWLRSYCARASSSNCMQGENASDWADACLARFRGRFR